MKCPDCDGKGKGWTTKSDSLVTGGYGIFTTCLTCKGTGEVHQTVNDVNTVKVPDLIGGSCLELNGEHRWVHGRNKDNSEFRYCSRCEIGIETIKREKAEVPEHPCKCGNPKGMERQWVCERCGNREAVE